MNQSSRNFILLQTCNNGVPFLDDNTPARLDLALFRSQRVRVRFVPFPYPIS